MGISNVIRRLRNNETITEYTYNKLNLTGTQPSVLYGFSKIHKAIVNGIPKLRPILSAINSPTYKLSQHLNNILKPYTSNEYTAKDSFSFATEARLQDNSVGVTLLASRILQTYPLGGVYVTNLMMILFYQAQGG